MLGCWRLASAVLACGSEYARKEPDEMLEYFVPSGTCTTKETLTLVSRVHVGKRWKSKPRPDKHEKLRQTVSVQYCLCARCCCFFALVASKNRRCKSRYGLSSDRVSIIITTSKTHSARLKTRRSWRPPPQDEVIAQSMHSCSRIRFCTLTVQTQRSSSSLIDQRSPCLCVRQSTEGQCCVIVFMSQARQARQSRVTPLSSCPKARQTVVLQRCAIVFEDITQESLAQDPSPITFTQLGDLQLPTAALQSISHILLDFSDTCTCVVSNLGLSSNSCCSIHVCTSPMSSALVTDAPTLALAQVLK